MNKNSDQNKSPLAPPSTATPDPKDTAQEAVHEVMPKEAAKKIDAEKKIQLPLTSKEHPKHLPTSPLRAAHGNDDLMSKQQQQSMPSADEVKGLWKQRVGAAKIQWGKLTDDELLQSEGHAQKLAGLVQERYAITRDEADKQIKGFFEKYRS